MDTAVSRKVARAREHFLSFGRVDPDVRAEIATSWRRSVMHGLTPTSALPRVATGPEPDGHLLLAAEPLLAHQRDTLAGLSAGLTLTDRTGRLLGRWVENNQFARRLDKRHFVPGMCVAEQMIGTSSSGISLVTGSAVLVTGHEHFSEGAVSLASAGAPVRHPVTRRILGSLNLACPADETNALILPWITELVAQIEAQLLGQSTHDQRVLFDAFLTSVRDARHPVVCLDRKTVITNVPAARLLDAADHAMLWEVAARCLRGERAGSAPICLSTGREIRVVCQPVYDGDHGVGALLHLTPILPTPARPAATVLSAVDPLLPALDALPGHAPAWQRFTAQVRNASVANTMLRITGEPGTGKTRVARAVAAGAGEMHVLDADVTTGAGWIDELSRHLDAATPVVLLRRIDLLSLEASDATLRLLRTHVRPGTKVIATEVPRACGSSSGTLEWPGTTVTAPPLRERLDDLSSLVAAITAELLVDDAVSRRLRWSAEAIQVLSRLVWPNNLHTLRALVEAVCAGTPGTIVLPSHIPAQLVARGSRRRLSGLEQMEAHAVVQALQTAKGNKSEAADALGIARSTLYRKVRALGLDLSTSTY